MTGIWSLAHRRSFEAVTGPKVDYWLVQTVGVLVIAIGATLAESGTRERPSRHVPLLGVASAVGLAGVDTVHVVRRRISPIYLLGSAAEIALIAAWAWVFAGTRVARRPGSQSRSSY